MQGSRLLIAMYNRQHVPSVFAQDDWKVSRRLTLNLGVRYDYFSPIAERITGKVTLITPRAR